MGDETQLQMRNNEERRASEMTSKINLGLVACLLLAVAAPVHGQKSRSAGGEIASGSGDVGKGVAKGAGNLAVGAGKGAVDLVTLHPVDAAVSVGKGGVSAGKNVAVGTTKGTGKIVIGLGKGIKHLF
jgi:hypothetical protein